jgi:hypothetical protein
VKKLLPTVVALAGAALCLSTLSGARTVATGRLFAQVRTAKNVAGEIRGQLVPAR